MGKLVLNSEKESWVRLTSDKFSQAKLDVGLVLTPVIFTFLWTPMFLVLHLSWICLFPFPQAWKDCISDMVQARFKLMLCLQSWDSGKKTQGILPCILSNFKLRGMGSYWLENKWGTISHTRKERLSVFHAEAQNVIAQKSFLFFMLKPRMLLHKSVKSLTVLMFSFFFTKFIFFPFPFSFFINAKIVLIFCNFWNIQTQWKGIMKQQTTCMTA